MVWTCSEAIRIARMAPHDQLCLLVAVKHWTSGGHKDADAAQTGIVAESEDEVLKRLLFTKSVRGQRRWPLKMGGIFHQYGDQAVSDNWAWDSVATKQHGLSNEINDVVLGLVSPRRGLSSNSPPKVM